jgi:hypothetical protein
MISLKKGLLRGQVGTVVESLAPGVYEVDFSDDAGQTYASLALRACTMSPATRLPEEF